MSTSAWIVANDEQEDQRVLAAFATRALAEQSGDVEVSEQPVHDQIERITLHMRDCYINADGTVRPGHAPDHSATFWDFEAPEPVELTRLPRYSHVSRIMVWQPSATQADEARLQQLDSVLADIAGHAGRTAEWLSNALEAARKALSPPAEERAILTWGQLAAFHEALRIRQDEMYERGCDLHLKYLTPPEPSLPPCFACGQTPTEILYSYNRVSLKGGQDMGFSPCGHQFHAADTDLAKLLGMA